MSYLNISHGRAVPFDYVTKKRQLTACNIKGTVQVRPFFEQLRMPRLVLIGHSLHEATMTSVAGTISDYSLAIHALPSGCQKTTLLAARASGRYKNIIKARC